MLDYATDEEGCTMHTTPHVTPDIQPDIPRDPDACLIAPDWSRGQAERAARAEGLTLSDEHWEVIQALRAWFSRHEQAGLPIHLRDLHDALDEAFHARGGIRYLYELFPCGPIAQGCRLAGIKPPFIARDPSFGSVA
ncbi:TusE/DsrC/DsvC family sulfur relay protein [Thiobacter aerophilum]|uniref:TusE/DsrC/DsvC family sulfur relay protein n=1 Tax=Thiobacter aerophilum TaxID=3121275 RepID=A0ABV0EDV4_9BURK